MFSIIDIKLNQKLLKRLLLIVLLSLKLLLLLSVLCISVLYQLQRDNFVVFD